MLLLSAKVSTETYDPHSNSKTWIGYNLYMYQLEIKLNNNSVFSKYCPGKSIKIPKTWIA